MTQFNTYEYVLKQIEHFFQETGRRPSVVHLPRSMADAISAEVTGSTEGHLVKVGGVAVVISETFAVAG